MAAVKEANGTGWGETAAQAFVSAAARGPAIPALWRGPKAGAEQAGWRSRSAIAAVRGATGTGWGASSARRPNADQDGVTEAFNDGDSVFQLLGCLSEHGKLGMTCIGRSAAEAEQVYARTKAELLDRR